ncbi:hypothetical protein [Winogradskyella sp.]|uniref:hypothetical protein n=1 Tax=Winogradskyella sp. TaxID=1883156 RepID=UPI003BAD5678
MKPNVAEEINLFLIQMAQVFLVLDTDNIHLDVEQLPDSSYEYTYMCNTITAVNFVITMMFTLEGNTLTNAETNGLEVPVIIDNGGFFV